MKKFWENKKVVVTGAAGFIGSHAVKTLIENGAVVTAIISDNTTDKQINVLFKNYLDKIFLKKVNLLNKESCIDATKDQEILLNFAALDGGTSFKQKYPAQIYKTNTQIVMNILDAAVKNKIERILIISSIEVYPKNLKSPIIEKYSLKENFQEEANGYTWSKRFGEIAAKMYTKEYGLKIAIARMGNVYGPGDYVNSEKGRVVPLFITQILEKKKVTLLGNGKTKRSFLYVSDAVDALLSLTELYPVCDPVNIVSSTYVTIKSLAEKIGKLTNQKVVFSFILDNLNSSTHTSALKGVVLVLALSTPIKKAFTPPILGLPITEKVLSPIICLYIVLTEAPLLFRCNFKLINV